MPQTIVTYLFSDRVIQLLNPSGRMATGWFETARDSIYGRSNIATSVLDYAQCSDVYLMLSV